MSKSCLPLKKCVCLAGAALIAQAPLAPALAIPPAGSLARASAHLAELRPDRAILTVLPPFARCARSDLRIEQNRKRLSLYLTVMARAFQLDDNELCAACLSRRALDLDQDNTEARACAAETLARTGRREESLRLYESLRQLSATNTVAMRALALRELRLTNYMAAARIFDAILQASPDDSVSRASLVRALAVEPRSARYIKAISELTSRETNPYMKETWQAYDCLKRADAARAQEHAEAAGSLNPADPAWHFQRGLALVSQDRVDDATRAFEEALACRRLSVRIVSSIASFYAYNHDPERALSILDRLEKARPWGFETAVARASVLEASGKPELAIAQYMKALNENPWSVTAYKQLGRLYASLGRYDDLLRLYRQWQSLLPDSPVALRHAGDAYRLKQDYRSALSFYDRALALSPAAAETAPAIERRELAMLHAGRGYAYFRLQDSAKAHMEARQFNMLKDLHQTPEHLKFIMLRPQRLSFKAGGTPQDQSLEAVALADLLFELGDLAASAEQYRKAIKLDPNNPDWHSCLFSVLMEKGDYIEALKEDLLFSTKFVSKAPQLIREWQKAAQAPKPAAASQ